MSDLFAGVYDGQRASRTASIPVTRRIFIRQALLATQDVAQYRKAHGRENHPAPATV